MAHIALIGAEIEENLALRYIESALKAAGHIVTIIPFNSRHDIIRASKLLIESCADIAGLSMVFTARAREFRDLAIAARSYGYKGHIIAGGHFAAFNAEMILNEMNAINSIAIGEGESIMCNLAACNADLSAVPGLIWRAHDGAIVKNIKSIPPADLDSLPYPGHKNPPDRYHDLPIANILSSRGCESSCSFCSISAWHKLCGGERLRLRDPQNIADEMAELYNRGYRIFNFHDDNFVLKNTNAMIERLIILKDAMQRHKIGPIAFAIKCRPDCVDLKVFELMKNMGLFRVFIGIEAGTDLSLNKLGRGHTIADNFKALEILNSLEMNICFNLILLNPDSTINDLKKNISFLKRFPSNPINFCRAEVYAGTPLEHKLRTSGKLLGDYFGFDYRITDEKTQLAFELMDRIMYNRHHSTNNLHQTTMILDYEYKLMSHFFSSSDKLNRIIKDFIIRVNHDSCSRLDTLTSYAENYIGSNSELDSFINKSTKSISLADKKFIKEGNAILIKIRELNNHYDGIRYSRFAKIAASIGFAAAVSTAAASCTGRTHMCEMAPAYHFSGWYDDSTYYQVDIGVPEPSIKNPVKRQNSSKAAAVQLCRHHLIKLIFNVELTDVDGIIKFKPSNKNDEEIIKTVMNGSIDKIIYDENQFCEVTYKITAPDLKKKIHEIQNRNKN